MVATDIWALPTRPMSRGEALRQAYFRCRRCGGLCGALGDPILCVVAEALPSSADRRHSRTMNGDDRRSDDDRQTGVVVKSKPKTKKPSLYKVLLLNDDYTPMEFVVHVLERFFGKGR